MSKSTQATRFAIITFFTMTLTFALAITFAPLAFGHDQHCIDLDWSQIICDQHNGTGGGGGGGGSTPTPAPTPPPRDFEAEHNHALGLAIAGLETQLPTITPDWEIWPPADANQIVFLPSFLAITDAGWIEIEASAAVGPSPQTVVTVRAVPKRTLWTFAYTKTGEVHPVICKDDYAQGSLWSPGVDPIPKCGWTFKNTSDIIGPVELEVVIGYDVSWTSSVKGYEPNAGTAESRAGTGTLVVSEVQTIGSTDFTSERGGNATVTAPEGDDIEITNEGAAGNGGSGSGGSGGSGGGNSGGAGDGTITIHNTDGDPTRNLPIRTVACIGEGSVGAHIVIGPDRRLAIYIILEEYADGTHVLTTAVETGAGVGFGGSIGAYTTVGDFTAGAFATTQAQVWATLAGGKEYIIGPGEDVEARTNDIIRGLVADLVKPPGFGVLDAIGVPTPNPFAVEPNAQYFEFKVWLEAGGSSQAGLGFINSHVGAGAEGTYAERVRVDDGGVSLITTYTGDLDIGLTGRGADGSEAGVGGSASGELRLETRYNRDREPVELIMTRSYSVDGDAGDLGVGNDTPTQTTQQWRLDLTNPEVADAVREIDETFGPLADEVPGLNPQALTMSLLTSLGSTSGPLTQQVTTTDGRPFGVGIGLGAGAEITSGSSCVELS